MNTRCISRWRLLVAGSFPVALAVLVGNACSSDSAPGAPVDLSGGSGGLPAGVAGAPGTGGSVSPVTGGMPGLGGSTPSTGGLPAASGGAATGGTATGGVAGTATAGGGSGGGGDGGGQGGGGGTLVAGGTAGSTSGAGGQGGRVGPDPGTEGDGDFEVGPNYTTQPDLTDRGAPKGKSFQFSMRLADSKIFDGTDATLDRSKMVNTTRSINVYVPAQYKDGTPAPVLVIQDGPGEINQVRNALDNLTIAQDETRRIPAFVAVAVQNGGNDAQGSERGLEYDTMSDRYARFIDQEVLPAVIADSAVKAAYPNLTFTVDPQGRAALGCSSGGAAALTMGWFRPDLFSRIITYSGTFVDQQDNDAAEEAMYPLGAWEYHSSKSLIRSSPKQELRIFLNVNENDLRATDPESTYHNWVMANERTAAALNEKGYHYRYVFGRGKGHCDGSVKSATLADALIWVWRGYEPSGQ
jgi:enterochelin esterase family protein